MKLRLLQKKDIKSASEIVGKNYSKKWQRTSALELSSMFSNSAIKPEYWVMEDKGEIIGFAGYTQSWMDYNVYQIFWVNVSPENQKQGIGKKLVGKIISEIKKKRCPYLIQLTATLPNSKYYAEHFGFNIIQHLGPKPYYYLMSLVLDPKQEA